MTTRGTMALVCLCALSACLAAMTQGPSGRQPVARRDRLQPVAMDENPWETSVDANASGSDPFLVCPPSSQRTVDANQPARLPTGKRAAPIVADAGQTAALRELLRREMPHATPADIDVWLRKFGGMPLSDARNMLELRRMVPIRPSRDVPFPPQTPSTILAPGQPTVVAPQPPRLAPLPMPTSEPTLLDPSLAALRQARDAILNNIANAKTPGFKRGRPVFADVSQTEPTAVTLPGEAVSLLDIGGGMRVTAIQRDWSRGKLVKTGRALDCAIDGKGFFVVRRGNQRAFTRNGNFERDANGRLVLATDRRWRVETASEPRVLGKTLGSEAGANKNKITLSLAVRPQPAKRRQSQRTLNVPMLPGALAAFARVGRNVDVQPRPKSPPLPSAAELIAGIRLATFANTDGLQPLGNGLFAETPSSGPAIIPDPQDGDRVRKIGSGFLEASNVDVQREFSELLDIAGQIQALRQAEAVLKDADIPPPSRGPIVEKPGLGKVSDHPQRVPETDDDGWFDRLFPSARYRELNRSFGRLDEPADGGSTKPQPMVPPTKRRRSLTPVIPANFEKLDSLEYPIEIDVL